MSTPELDTATTAAPAASVAGGSTTRAGFWRRQRSTLLIVAALALAVLIVVRTAADDTNAQSLDPSNPGPGGAQAVARVLEDEGVDIEVVRSADDFDRARVDSSTTVVVTRSSALGESTYDRLVEHADGAQVILVNPGVSAVEEVGVDLPDSADAGDGLPADCDDPVYADLELETDRVSTYPAEGCFDASSEDAEDNGDGPSSVIVERDGVVLFGAGEALSNDQVLRGDNAAVALRALGQQPRLVWYVATADDLSAADADTGVNELLPPWIRPGLWMLAVAVVGLVIWRSRRLGPLVTEPLPVAVKAIETTESRGRLYRRAGDRGHAASALRSAARTRAAKRLRLGPGVDESTLIRDLARHLDRPESAVGALVGSFAPAPGSDQELIELASALAALEEEVRRT